jgi:hypothetical protein
VRVLWISTLLGSLSASVAPLQCGSGEPDPALRRNETPDEALYVLATKFRQNGDERAWRTTLEHLVERYPNGRFAVRARLELAGK